jgi:hypothetical protein
MTLALRPVFALLLALSAAVPASADETYSLSPSLDRVDLMKASFEGWTPEKPCCWSLVVPDGIEWSPWLPKPGRPGKTVEIDSLLITPLHVIRLDETHAALVTVSSPADANGEVSCGHTCSHFISVVPFKAEGNGWREGDHVDAAAWVAFYPAHNWVQTWPGHGFVVSFTSGSCWQGACTDDVVLLGLQPDRVLPLLATSFDEDNSAESESGVGESATGAWRFDGDHVVFTFRGAKQDDVRKRPKTWTRTVTLALKGERLVPVSGELPSFGF